MKDSGTKVVQGVYYYCPGLAGAMAQLEHEDLTWNLQHSLKKLRVLGSPAILGLPG